MRPDVHMLTGAYAVDALSGQERTAFEQHMRQCPACAQEVAELQETAARLGTATDTPAPASLKPRVLTKVAQVRQLPPSSDKPPRVSGLRKPRWLPQVTAAAAAASVVLAIMFGLSTMQANQRLTDELSQLRGTSSQLDHLTDLVRAPDTKLVSGEATTGGGGTAVLSRSKGEVLFVADQLPALPSDRAYQLWLIDEDGPRSAGLLTPEQTLVADHIAHEVSDATNLALTIEPVDGSPRPTTSSILLINLPE